MGINIILTSLYNFATCKDNKRNPNWRYNKQMNALQSYELIFMVAGMEMTLGLLWTRHSQHYQYSWFIGVILGAVISSFLTTTLNKKMLMLISGVLTVVAGVLYASDPSNEDICIAARYINGFAMGFTVVPFFIHASEIAAKEYRGTCLGLEGYTIAAGIALRIELKELNEIRLHGCLGIAFGVIALLCIYLMRESPTFQLRNGDDGEALENLMSLETPPLTEVEASVFLDEQKSYIKASELQREQGWIVDVFPLLRMMLYRVAVALTFSAPLNLFVENFGYQPYVLSTNRWVGAILSVMTIDFWGRKLTALVALFVVSLCTLAVGVLCQDRYIYGGSIELWVIGLIVVISQFFGALFAPSSSVYLGEAFSLQRKPYCIAFCIVVEQLVHIITITNMHNILENISIFGLTVGCLLFLLFLIFCLTMPETKNKTLQEAEELFTNTFNRDC